MGAAGSVDEQAGGGEADPGGHRPPSTVGSERNTPTGSRPGSRPTSRRASVSSGHTWRSNFRGSALHNSSLRKMRAMALGRKSAVTVTIDKTGFNLQHIRICEGQVVSFEWNEPESQGFNVTQVTHDGDQYRPVPGGFNSGPVTRSGRFIQQYNLVGEYKFVSAGIRCTPLTVEVFPRKDVEAELNDQGFAPKIIRLDEGSAVTWRWTGCSMPHTVSEVRYNHKRGAMVQKEHMERAIPTKAGSFRKDFAKPGIYYFQTEGSTTGSLHTCIVHVRERQREVRIEVHDRSFSPPILVIEEGDRVWWTWNKDKCKKVHSIYQIEPPPLNIPQDESYKPMKNGFKWPQPSKCALMSYEFYEQGVYYFSDHSFDEAAEYIGTIIVKPKTKDHFIEITAEGFTPDLLYADVGDRIWWNWACEDASIPKFSLREVDKVLSPLANRPAIEEENSGEGSYMDDALESLKIQVGLELVQLGSIGVYTYCLADPNQRSIASCSIVSSAGSRNHTVHVTDSGFEPKVVTVHPTDRVWWVWQDSKQQHNIIQVSHQGNHINGGFCSGAPSDCPSAFMAQFSQPGVYYYISSSLAKSFGAVVVSSQPKVHEVQVSAASIAPDPVILSVNDVVVWTFKGLRNHDVQQLTTFDELLDIQVNSHHLQHARRTLSRLFTEKGLYHYTSKAFLKSTKGEQRSDESRISTLLVDDPSDSIVVRVNSQGFHPKNVNITKGQSVLWTWKEAGEEAHNIIHVNSPDSDAPLSVIQGGQSFNSGRPVAKNSFLYTFDEPNNYCVASQGAPGFAGSVTVLNHSKRAETPYISSRKLSGEVPKNSVVQLECETAGAQIYYTLDGTAPDQSRVIPKLYKPDKGVVLRQSGLVVLRAIAIANNTLNSHVMTSKRMAVLPGEDDNQSVSSEEPDQMPTDNSASWQWWQCVPVVKGCFTGSGMLEVFWEPPPPESIQLIKGYQVFLNGVSYCPAFPSSHNSVNVAGLAGGRMYEILLEVYPHDAMYLPHKSNKLMMKCPKTTSTGGALISIEQTEKPDTLTIVWMAIATPDCPIKGYRVYLNGQMCGSQVVPDANSDRCKVVIEGCSLQTVYRVIVAAIPTDGSTPKMSNELEIQLPLDLANIRIPPAELRAPDDDLYREYIEVSEGAGYVDSTVPARPQADPVTFDLTDQNIQAPTEPDFQVKLDSIALAKAIQDIKTSEGKRMRFTADKSTQYEIPEIDDEVKENKMLTNKECETNETNERKLQKVNALDDNEVDIIEKSDAGDLEDLGDLERLQMAAKADDIFSTPECNSVAVRDGNSQDEISDSAEQLTKAGEYPQNDALIETSQNKVSDSAEQLQNTASPPSSLIEASDMTPFHGNSEEETELVFDNSTATSEEDNSSRSNGEVEREGSRNPNLASSSSSRSDGLVIEEVANKDEVKPEDEGFHGDKDDESIPDDQSVNESLDPGEVRSKSLKEKAGKDGGISVDKENSGSCDVHERDKESRHSRNSSSRSIGESLGYKDKIDDLRSLELCYPKDENSDMDSTSKHPSPIDGEVRKISDEPNSPSHGDIHSIEQGDSCSNTQPKAEQTKPQPDQMVEYSTEVIIPQKVNSIDRCSDQGQAILTSKDTAGERQTSAVQFARENDVLCKADDKMDGHVTEIDQSDVKDDTQGKSPRRKERHLEDTGESEDQGQMLGEGPYPSDEGYPSESDAYHAYTMASGAGMEGIQGGLQEEGDDPAETNDQEEEEEYDDYVTGPPGGMPIQPLKLKSSSGSLGQLGIGTGSLGPQQVTQQMGMPVPIRSASQGSMQYVAMMTPGGPGAGAGERAPQPPMTPRPPPVVGKPPRPPVHEAAAATAAAAGTQYVEGVRYHAHTIPQQGGDAGCGFIDATQGPWRNRMKGAAQLSVAMQRGVPSGPSMEKPAYHKGDPVPPPGGVVVDLHGDLDSQSEGADIQGQDRGPSRNAMKSASQIPVAMPRCIPSRPSKENPVPPPGGMMFDLHNDLDSQSEDTDIQGQDHGKKRKRKKTAAVVEVQDGAHLRYEREKGPTTGITATAAVPVLGHQEGQEQYLPAPIVSAENRGQDRVVVRWTFERSAEPLYRLMVSVVNVVGRRFTKHVGSDISFECLQEEGNGTVSAVQHCWNVTSGSELEVGGLVAGTSYTIFVVANYALVNARTPTELQAKSNPVRYTTLGAPSAPVLRPFASDLYQVTLSWDRPEVHAQVELTGYRILVDGLQLGDLLGRQTNKTTIDNLQPGRTISVSVIAVTNHQVGSSEPSNPVRVTCPPRPAPPAAAQQPSYKRGSVIVAWERPYTAQAVSYGMETAFYRVFADNAWHGEVVSTTAGNRSGYQYYLTDLQSGQAYDINVRAYAGQVKVDPQADQVFCLSEGEPSNTVPVMCPAPPKSPCLRVEGMHSQGIDITWEMPQQFGDAQISGYQLMKDAKLYGSIMPPDVHSLRIKDVTLGDRVQLQILALTDHPVGREARDREARGHEVKGHEGSKEPRSEEDGDSGVGTATQATDTEKAYQEVYLGDRYSACRPGPTLVVMYTGLVSPPDRVWCEVVNGHSAMIVWQPAREPKAHFILPENYQVTWWPKDQGEDQINSQSTKDDHILVTGLKANTIYNVVVESRKMQCYSAIHEGEKPVDDGYGNMFILTGKTEPLTVRTARPPAAPTNLGITATTCSSIQVAWDPPVEITTEVLTVRVDAVAMRTSGGGSKHTAVEVMPEASSATLEGLAEKTEFLLTVTFVTEEYFEQLPEGTEIRSKRTLPVDKPPPENPWLPCSSMIAMTSGSEAPTNIKVKATSINSVTLTWTPPVVYGSNRLQGTVLRWTDPKTQQGDQMAHHKSITADCNEATLDDLFPGVLYKVTIEAVVSVKTNIVGDSRDPEEEKRNRRTTHVPAKAVYVRARAPCEPPVPLITAYTNESIQLYWEKPRLYRLVGENMEGHPRYLKLSLEGYRLEINGKPHMKLMSSAQSCTLVKCRPGKIYQIVLVAITCPDEVKRERKRKGKDSSETEENSADDWANDESPSEPLEIALPGERDNSLSELNVNFAAPSGDTDADEYMGDAHVEWSVSGKTDAIDQFLVTWRCDVGGAIQRKVVSGASRIASIPVTRMKCVYDVYVEPQYTHGNIGPEPQKCQVLVPGPPDAAEIWMRSAGRDEFIIEWGEPRLYGVRVQGYQVYLNGKKVGNQLSHSHRKAVIPCKPRRTYKVNLVVLSADPNYRDSPMSNTLVITAGTDNVRYMEGPPSVIENEQADDNSDLPVRIVKVTDTTIQLDWIKYNETDDVVYYRVTWSSVAQPAEREVKLPVGEKSCMLHKCFPGTNHFLRVYAMGRAEQTLEVSRQMTVQTCAPPDTPVLTVRACNFRYIAVEWEKPTTYGDTAVTGYKVYVNGVVEAVLGADQFSYSFTQGHWCREYAFQVQAATAVEKLHSKPSEPLVVKWPGVQPPVLRRVPAVTGNTVKVVWDIPATTDGIKVKMYKVICLDAETEEPVQVVSPIHPETTEAQLHNLKAGSYNVYAEVHLHGTTDVVKSELLSIQPTLTPDPPHITVTVIGLDERRQVEKITCDLINKRDRLINFLTNREVSQSLRINDEDQVLVKVTEDLAHVEDMLDDCLSSLTHYTGHLLAHVSWACPQSNPDIQVSGYQVLVDGKQYGTTLHSGIQNVRIKLGLQHASHRLSMVSVAEKPRATSVQSNVVELLTEPFKPFSFFSFLGPNGPKTAGLYAPTLLAERKERRTINQGLLKRHVPPPAATLMEVFEGEYRPLFPPAGPRSPTAILFWTKWNPASRRALGWFVRFARSHSSQYEFIAVACMSNDPTANDRQELVHVITENGWRDDKCVRHVTSQCAAPSTMGADYIKSRNGDVDAQTTSTDVTKLFGVAGVPMLAIVHPGDYIAWKGRYCSYDYISHENFLNYVFSQATGQGASVADPWDTNIDVDALDGVSKRGQSEAQLLIHRPTSNTRVNTGNTTTHRINNNRPPSAKNPLFRKTAKKPKDKLSVNSRPYSASSPYSQKLISEDTMGAPPKRRVKSGRKTNGYY